MRPWSLPRGGKRLKDACPDVQTEIRALAVVVFVDQFREEGTLGVDQVVVGRGGGGTRVWSGTSRSLGAATEGSLGPPPKFSASDQSLQVATAVETECDTKRWVEDDGQRVIPQGAVS